jgi:hypothetical protein
MQLHWKPNLSTSALHAAEACWRYPEQVNDPEVLSTMRPYGERLGRWITELHAVEKHGPVEPQGFWDTLITTGSAIDSNRELAAAVLRNRQVLDTDGSLGSLLADLITDVEAAFRQLFPRYDEQSAFRFRPLQEQWLGYGRGLMNQWKRLVRQDALVDRCTVIGLQPILGGFGKAHPDSDLVRIEAVLTNARPELPEVIRLGWLLAQMECESSELFLRDVSVDLPTLIPLATIPSILAAGQELELTRCDSTHVALAIKHWHVSSPCAPLSETESPSKLASSLLAWWNSSERAQAPWQASVQMLAKQLYD